MQDIQANLVQARRFELVDDTDTVRAQIGYEAERVWLELYKPDSTPRISIGVNSNDAAILTLRDGQGHNRARVAVENNPDGNTILNVRDGQERIRAELLLEESGAIGIVLTDEWGQSRMQIRVSTDGTASVGVADDEGNYSGITNE